jgi:hypothetical protein
VFNKVINETTLTSEVADRLFSNITNFNTPDKSFLATLRALLRNRLEPNETVHLSCECRDFSESAISAVSPSERVNIYIPDSIRNTNPQGYSIHIIYAEHPDSGSKMLEIISAEAGAEGSYIKDYVQREKLRVFFARKAKALFFTDAAERNTIIFIEKLELKHFHALQMMIPKYLPCLFVDTPLTETEIALIKSTGNKSANEYESLIESFAKDLDIRAEIIRSKLAGFETTHERNRSDEIRAEIISHETQYEFHLSMLREVGNKIQDLKYTLAGLDSVIGEHSADSELMEYFICNKRLTLIKAAGTSIEFIVHGYADIYDVDAFEQYVNNHNSFLYENLGTSFSKEQMEKLYRAIFSDRKYKIRLCAAYTADIRLGLTPKGNYAFPSESSTYLPNPHIQNHGCIGGFAERFQEYLQKRDYVGAIDQAIVSARNLNFFDSTVIKKFAAKLSTTGTKCIEKSDGTLLSPREAIRELEGA